MGGFLSDECELNCNHLNLVSTTKFNKIMELRKLIIASLVLFTFPTYAQPDNERISIFVQSTCEKDNVGQRMIYRVREGLRSSKRLNDQPEYIKSVIQLRITCLSPDSNSSGVVSKYSYVITALNSDGDYDYHITSGVGECGSKAVLSCAESLVARTDSAFDNLLSTYKNGKLKYAK